MTLQKLTNRAIDLYLESDEFKNKVERIIIGSPDKDLAQCVEGEKVVMWSTRNKEYTNEQGVRDKFGVNPNQIPDYLALAGDVSDGIPGIKGVGPKTASFLISKYGDKLSKIAEKNKVQVFCFQLLEYHRYTCCLGVGTEYPIPRFLKI